ncbi:ABC transporter ATP-binding protein [Ornithinimicrobium sufpigmenti]|uniref:ABC transporter ATP-binding protein n=1 Tax=Ornithinimicrobium sufpigmenti TaxID=2508882 RepID=UPI001035795E|nr:MULTISPECIES: ABC transporter ATP-binding protein [unclassified Ornithinimicrobium]
MAHEKDGPHSASTESARNYIEPDFNGAAVKISGVSKSYGSVKAVDDVSLDVAGGEFLSLLGPSGSGKTTLFMTIAGFEKAQAGRIQVAGRDVTNAPPYNRGFGMVFQRYALFPHMTVAQNVAYALKMRGIKSVERERMVSEALEMVDLIGYGPRRPDQLSGGQQQRVALARALVYRPKVLLMDEPLAALDRKLREQVQLELRRLHKELGITVLYVTHDQEEAMVMSDRVCVMRDGRLLQVGRPTELYDDPIDSFVAGFLGRSNFLPATLINVADGRATVKLGDATVPVHIPSSGSLPSVGSRVHVAVRPEHVNLTAGSGIPGQIAETIFTGATTSIRVDLGFGFIDSTMVTDSRTRAFREGDSVTVTWADGAAKAYPLEEIDKEQTHKERAA